MQCNMILPMLWDGNLFPSCKSELKIKYEIICGKVGDGGGGALMRSKRGGCSV